MSGEGDYVRKYEDEVYNNIKIKSYKQEFVNIIPNKQNFKVKMPSYYSFVGNKNDNKKLEDTEIYAFDEQENAHYFLMESTLMDISNLEDSEYELKRMHYEFYNAHELDSTQTHFDKNKFEFTSQSKLKEKVIHLKSVLKGNKYYLLGTVNASKNKVDTFFNSFEITTAKEEIVYKTFKDSSAHFSVEIPKQQNEYLDFKFDRKKRYDDADKTNHFEVKFKTFEIFSPNKNVVEITYSQPHRYESYAVLDSLFNRVKKNITTDFESRKFSQNNDYRNVDYATAVVDAVAASDASSFASVANLNEEKEGEKFNPLDYESTTWDKTLALSHDQKLELTNEKFLKDEPLPRPLQRVPALRRMDRRIRLRHAAQAVLLPHRLRQKLRQRARRRKRLPDAGAERPVGQPRRQRVHRQQPVRNGAGPARLLKGRIRHLHPALQQRAVEIIALAVMQLGLDVGLVKIVQRQLACLVCDSEFRHIAALSDAPQDRLRDDHRPEAGRNARLQLRDLDRVCPILIIARKIGQQIIERENTEPLQSRCPRRPNAAQIRHGGK